MKVKTFSLLSKITPLLLVFLIACSTTNTVEDTQLVETADVQIEETESSIVENENAQIEDAERPVVENEEDVVVTSVKLIPKSLVIENDKIYQVQVAALIRTKNAKKLVTRLLNAGFQTKIQKYGRYTRVTIPNVKGQDLPEISSRLSVLGINEIWVRD